MTRNSRGPSPLPPSRQVPDPAAEARSQGSARNEAEGRGHKVAPWDVIEVVRKIAADRGCQQGRDRGGLGDLWVPKTCATWPDAPVTADR